MISMPAFLALEAEIVLDWAELIGVIDTEGLMSLEIESFLLVLCSFLTSVDAKLGTLVFVNWNCGSTLGSELLKVEVGETTISGFIDEGFFDADEEEL